MVEQMLNDWPHEMPESASASGFEQRAQSGMEAIEERLGFRSGGARLVTPEGVVVSADSLKKRSSKGSDPRASLPFPPVVLTEGLTYDVMAHSDALIECSGTATLEAALLGTPMVILYRGSKLMEIEAKITKVRPEHFGLPNILADRRIVPELVQHEASPEALAGHTIRFIRDPAARGEVKAALAEIRKSLGESGASERTAKMTLELAGLG
jgi:lipid-A-disaccharide synthase